MWRTRRANAIQQPAMNWVSSSKIVHLNRITKDKNRKNNIIGITEEQKLPMIKIKLNGMKVRALIDTGASVSCITKWTANKWIEDVSQEEKVLNT
ncbi:hypothetical protein SNEBB_009064, partial [Seison nebaliae]